MKNIGKRKRLKNNPEKKTKKKRGITKWQRRKNEESWHAFLYGENGVNIIK